MPFIKTQMVITKFESVKFDPDGLTIGQQVDQILAEKMDMHSTGNGEACRFNSVEFGFEGDGDWEAYMRSIQDAKMATYADTVPTRKKGAVPVKDY